MKKFTEFLNESFRDKLKYFAKNAPKDIKHSQGQYRKYMDRHYNLADRQDLNTAVGTRKNVVLRKLVMQNWDKAQIHNKKLHKRHFALNKAKDRLIRTGDKSGLSSNKLQRYADAADADSTRRFIRAANIGHSGAATWDDRGYATKQLNKSVKRDRFIQRAKNVLEKRRKDKLKQHFPQNISESLNETSTRKLRRYKSAASRDYHLRNQYIKHQIGARSYHQSNINYHLISLKQYPNISPNWHRKQLDQHRADLEKTNKRIESDTRKGKNRVKGLNRAYNKIRSNIAKGDKSGLSSSRLQRYADAGDASSTSYFLKHANRAWRTGAPSPYRDKDLEKSRDRDSFVQRAKNVLKKRLKKHFPDNIKESSQEKLERYINAAKANPEHVKKKLRYHAKIST